MKASLKALRLTDLMARKIPPTKLLRCNISQKGYALVHVNRPKDQQNIRRGLDEAASMSGFRFPPIDTAESFCYNDAKRKCFESLLDIAVTTFASLTHQSALPSPLVEALNQYPDLKLFGENFDRHTPFVDGDPFGQTFFNLFSYDSGMLNSHKDRGLLTVIASRVPDNASDLTALWVKTPKTNDSDQTRQWENIDQQTLLLKQETDDVVVTILLGEEGESLPFSTKHNLRAAQHAVRVDPHGEFVSRAHYRSDPATRQDVPNRLSAALILGHDSTGVLT